MLKSNFDIYFVFPNFVSIIKRKMKMKMHVHSHNHFSFLLIDGCFNFTRNSLLAK